MKKRKSDKTDPYTAKYLVSIISAKTKKEIVAVIDKIYQDGFEDGANNADMKEQKECYFVMQTQINSQGEYRALIAKEGEKGYYVTDWFWGKDFKIAEQLADQKNARLGISKKEANKIILGTMRR